MVTVPEAELLFAATTASRKLTAVPGILLYESANEVGAKMDVADGETTDLTVVVAANVVLVLNLASDGFDDEEVE